MKRNKKISFACAFIFLFTLSGVAASQESEKKILSFGVVPQQSASKMARLWTPILIYIGKKTGYRLQFKTAPNIPIFEQRLAAGKYDMAYMNPYHFTVFSRSPGYVALAKAKDKKIKGIIVVRKDSPYQSLEEFKGKTLAFPAPAAFAASVLTRAYFKQNNIAIKPRYVSSHDSVYRNVAKGLFPAGGGVVRTFRNLNTGIQNQLRILWTTKGFTPHAIAAHPRLSKKIRNKIKEALVQMAQDPEGKKLLQTIKLKGLVSADNKDWDDVRALGIDMLNQLIKSN